MKETETILLFDGVCNLCSNSVQFVLKRNTKKNIKFASLQSKFGEEVISNTDLPSGYLASLLLIKNGIVYIKSDAALEVAKDLNGFWKLTAIFILVPRIIRNPIYDWIARNRYRWFGKKETCWIPEDKWNNRFLD